MYAIETTDVTKTYGDVVALDGLSLAVEAGSTFGLLGTNGAGKTTLFKLLVNHRRPDAGSLSVAGMDVATAGRDVRRVVGYLPERAGFPPSLAGREVLRFHARMHGIDRGEREERVAEVLETVGLPDAADRAVGGYSNGMNRRLGLATALLHRPRVLLLDEPTAGLDPQGVAAFHRIVERLHEERDLTVVLSSHVLSEVEALCDRVAILHDGRLRARGSLSALRAELGEGVTVRLRLAPGADGAAVADEAAAHGEVLTAAGEVVEVACGHAAVPGLLQAALDRDTVAGYEVREPGLAQVFEAAVSEQAAGREGLA
ncbi:MAG TPA: ABC transporter ATP-binding protein [Halobacteriales archaeon]|nr:ABC transporter ATP-binding protein [Halobacteriales archaeon]